MFTTHNPVSSDLARHLAQEARDDARAADIEAKIEELMAKGPEVGQALDDLMADSDVTDDGHSVFAGGMAAVLLASDAAFEAEAIQFFLLLRDQVRHQLTSRADALVQCEDDKAEEDEAEYRANLAEDSQ